MEQNAIISSENMYTYLTLNILTILFPFLFSFERRVCFRKHWRNLFLAIFISGILFLVWDSWFVSLGIWGFNHKYLLGLYLFNIPLEEVLFFVVTPYACVFIYEVMKYFLPSLKPNKLIDCFSILLGFGFLLVAIMNRGRLYTFTTFLCSAILLFVNVCIIKPKYLNYFYIAYFISIIPKWFINGILTGGVESVDNNPIVWYNNFENLGIRMGTIPLEDFCYSFLLLLLNINLYEYFKERGNK